MTAGYRILLTERARKDLKKLPHDVWLRFDEAFVSLSHLEEPRHGVKRLRGTTAVPFYSLRIGSYRAILHIFDDKLVILVLQVKSRNTVYRNL
jgi:mRNA interferase RelE/StbE